MKDEPLVRVEDLHRYYGPVHAVRGVSFALHRGQIMGFLGVNGAGKSTTLAMLAGVLAPSHGRVEICGHDLLDAPRTAKARLGYLPDNPPLYDSLTVDEYLAFCAGLRGLNARERRAAVGEARRRCGLDHVRSRLLGNLSKGYRQRAGIAQAIVHSPQVLLLDEPTSGLDPVQIREIRSLVRELGREHAVLLSSHILQEVQMLCDRVLIIHDGRMAHLASLSDDRGIGREYRVRLAGEVDDHALERLPGARVVSRIGNDGVTLALETPEHAPRVVAALVERGLAVAEFTALSHSLEDLFVSIAAGDSADQPDVAAQ